MSEQAMKDEKINDWQINSICPRIYPETDDAPIFEKSYALGITSEDAISIQGNIFDVSNLHAIGFELTNAEIHVANLVCRGYSNREIANIRSVSNETIKCQVSHLLSKTYCRNRVELLILTAIISAHYANTEQ